MERHLDSEVIQRICRDPELLRHLRQRLGDDLTLWRSEIWVNYPAQQLIPFWHRDVYPKLLSGSGKSIHAYIALTDVTADNGFEYVPIAELNDTNHTVKLSDPFSGNNLFEIDAALEKKAIAIALQAGEFVLFTDQLIHRSIRNTSGRVRLSMVLRITQNSLRASGYTSASGDSSMSLSTAIDDVPNLSPEGDDVSASSIP
jgi:ectoine hydroxylase-related dioxygenase (phytanoyl-CoA dioxygenase family)